jgi:transposase InsO family protein
LQRHGISRLPQIEGEASPKRKFKPYPIGYFHLDIAEVQTGQGKLYLFVAIDRTSKFAVARLVDKANTQTARLFLEAVVAAVPYRVEIVLTDNGIQFADLPNNRSGPTARLRGHPFDRACREHGIEHRLTKPNHPWTNGQVERMNRTIKDATVKRYHYEAHDQLVRHLADFVAALQLRPATEDPQRPHLLRVRLQTMDNRAGTIQTEPAPENARTKHLGRGKPRDEDTEGGIQPANKSLINRRLSLRSQICAATNLLPDGLFAERLVNRPSPLDREHKRLERNPS